MACRSTVLVEDFCTTSGTLRQKSTYRFASSATLIARGGRRFGLGRRGLPQRQGPPARCRPTHRGRGMWLERRLSRYLISVPRAPLHSDSFSPVLHDGVAGFPHVAAHFGSCTACRHNNDRCLHINISAKGGYRVVADAPCQQSASRRGSDGDVVVRMSITRSLSAKTIGTHGRFCRDSRVEAEMGADFPVAWALHGEGAA